jgi:flavin reductase (DIM6/NTAB) family NADH-FMN oxidoreductase RutF
MTVSSDQLREAMGNFATGVTVITTWEPNGNIHGMTANAVTSVSLDPPLILIIVGHQRNTYTNIQNSNHFGVNVLGKGQEGIAEYFSRSENTPEENSGAHWESNNDGSPMMEGAVIFLDCSVRASHSYGDHTVYISNVNQVKINGGTPLIYHKGQLKNVQA